MNRRVSRHIAVAAVMALVAVVAAGCNTVAGAGQDAAAAGHAISNTADKVKQAM